MTRSADVIALLVERNLRVAIAESLTGGALIAELIDTPGASDAVLGGIVAYNTELKHTILGVDAAILNVHGPIHPDVAIEMAVRVRDVLAVGGLAAEVGVGTTGVAGPDAQDGHAPGTVYVALAIGADVRVRHLQLQGDRNDIRRQVVELTLDELRTRLSET